MKVGLYIGDIAPSQGGGYTFVFELLSALNRLRKDCKHELIICHDEAGESIARLFPQFPCLNLEREKANVITARERILESLPKLVQRAYRKLRPRAALSWEDRIFTRAGIQFIVCILPWKITSMNIPFSATVWDLQHRNSPWFPEVSQFQMWDDREKGSTALRRASLIYTGTEQGRREIALYYQVPPERIKVLPFAAPVFALEAANRPKTLDFFAKFGLPSEYIFYPAQFWPHKNHVLVLEACRILRDTVGWNLAVVFTGLDKGNLDYVREYAQRLGLEDQVRVLGFVKQADLIDLYKGALCLVFPTFCGPDNLPPLEAFALGCPVIASAVPGAREQLGEAAILIPPTNERALAEAILKLRDQETRERFIKAGHIRALASSWDHYVRGLCESLDEFAGIRRAWR
jgi:glycosyltransferase involved in cell wall biosynthesis